MHDKYHDSNDAKLLIPCEIDQFEQCIIDLLIRLCCECVIYCFAFESYLAIILKNCIFAFSY
jgi:hypothetical protein